jgi:hypothetical protein
MNLIEARGYLRRQRPSPHSLRRRQRRGHSERACQFAVRPGVGTGRDGSPSWWRNRFPDAAGAVDVIGRVLVNPVPFWGCRWRGRTGLLWRRDDVVDGCGCLGNLGCCRRLPRMGSAASLSVRFVWFRLQLSVPASSFLGCWARPSCH